MSDLEKEKKALYEEVGFEKGDPLSHDNVKEKEQSAEKFYQFAQKMQQEYDIDPS